MPLDPRFYASKQSFTLDQFIALCGGRLISGDPNSVIEGVAPADRAQPGEICFIEARSWSKVKLSPVATFCILSEKLDDQRPAHLKHVVAHANPRWAHMQLAKAMYEPRTWQTAGPEANIHPTAQIHTSAVLAPGVRIGARTKIGPNANIGYGVEIGEDCTISAGVTLEYCLLGNGVSLHPGVQIGQSGFGVLIGPDGTEDIPHWGRVVIEDKVSIGAGTCVDRGAFDDTLIGANTKIDNLCQIAHNVQIGKNVRIASLAGISGSVKIGDRALLAGRVGIVDHVTIGQDVQLLAASGVMHDIPDGERWGGQPAQPWRDFFREVAWVQKNAAKKAEQK